MKLICLMLPYVVCVPLQAAVIGTDQFNYPDGNITGANGGSGWDFLYATTSGGNSISSWTTEYGSVSVGAGSISTMESGAIRAFGGNEASGAFQANGIIFFRVDLTRGAGTAWSGLSFFDFGAERLFFGVLGNDPGDGIREYGIEGNFNGNPIGSSYTGVDANTTFHTIAGVLDFNNDLLGLWLDPDSSDSWSPTGGTADAKLAYTGTNWMNSVRLASGGSSATIWDNLTLSTTAAEVGLLGIPEPSAGLLAGLGLLGLTRRRRYHK